MYEHGTASRATRGGEGFKVLEVVEASSGCEMEDRKRVSYNCSCRAIEWNGMCQWQD